MYFSGQGKVFIAPIVDGVPGQFKWIGNVPDFKPGFDTSKLEHKESYSGQRLLDKVITTENKSTITAELEDWSPENLALVTRGTVTELAGGVVGDTEAAEAPRGMGAGSVWALGAPKLSNLVIKDSAGTAAQLVAGTDYTVDTDFGVVTFNDVSTFTQPFKATYTYGDATSVSFFTAGIQEVAVRFEGVNTAENNRKVIVELYRVALDPTKELGLITDDLGKFTLEGNALMDASRPYDPAFGLFGRMIYL